MEPVGNQTPKRQTRSIHIASFRTILAVSEFVRWGMIIAAVYLSVWQYCKIAGYTIFVSDMDVYLQFWLVFSAIIVGVSLVFYLPWRLVSLRLRRQYNCLQDERW